MLGFRPLLSGSLLNGELSAAVVAEPTRPFIDGGASGYFPTYRRGKRRLEFLGSEWHGQRKQEAEEQRRIAETEAYDRHIEFLASLPKGWSMKPETGISSGGWRTKFIDNPRSSLRFMPKQSSGMYRY